MKRIFYWNACILAVVLLCSGQALAQDEGQYSGWWWDPGYSGVGFSIGTDGDNLYLAYYAYETSGPSVWYSSLIQESFDGIYRGELFRYNGGSPPAESRATPASEEFGKVKIDFADSGHATLRLYSESNGLDTAFSLDKFLPGLDQGDPDPRGLCGWFWNPDLSGMGFFLEARGQTLYMAWYTYRGDGSPRWYAMGAGTQDPAFVPGSISYSAEVLEYSDGYAGQEYKSPVTLPTGETGELVFWGSGDDLLIDFTWQGTTYNLEPFRFSGIELASPERSFYVIGDSWSAYPASYNVFQPWFDENGLENFTVYAYAVSGSMASQWADESYAAGEPFFEALAGDALPDPVIYLTLGGNDGTSGGDLEQIPIDLALVVDRILAARPDARIIIASLDTLNPDKEGCGILGDVLTLNTALDTLAGYQAQVAEAYPEVYAAYVMGTLQGNPGNPDLTQPCDLKYLGDCIHLNEEGYTLVIGQALDMTYAETFFMD